MHRSGTSPLHRCIRAHPQVSGISGTDVPEDEGQHLQKVLPTGEAFGGPGKFGMDPASHMIESHPAATAETAQKLFDAWKPYWDLSKPFLAEKSPPTILRTRLFQKLFPDSYFVVIVRHPAASALATIKFAPTIPVDQMIEHWVHCHEVFLADAAHLKRVVVVKYEQFSKTPDAELARVYGMLGLAVQPADEKIREGVNDNYRQKWQKMGWWGRRRSMKWEPSVRKFGYSLRDWNLCEPFPSLGRA